ncbi:MAG: DEAD/DEAH box helicase family protein [Methyloprofundus sp.]|nr:DEAD/DEAH box helicase family protein [Methyloprofundus sp.]
MVTNRIIDNQTSDKLVNYLAGQIKSNDQISLILKSLTLSGFEALKAQLKKTKTRLVLATNTQPLAQRLACESGEESRLNKLQQKELAAEFLTWLEQNVEAKGIDENRVPQNLFLIRSDNQQSFIQGSSHLTASGLGLIQTQRLEMNMGSDDPLQAQAIERWFNQTWQDQQAVTSLQQELKNAAQLLAQDQSPETIYFFTLYRIFNDLLDEIDEESIVKTKTGFKQTLVWNKLYKFQKDGVLGVIDKLERHNGCILADSVGLGKTFEALAVIKYYELRNDRVLVLAPKKLRDNWTLYTQNDRRNLLSGDRFSYDVLNHTDLTRTKGHSGDINLETVNWGNYDLVVIDESHNFRNASTADEKHTRYSKLMDDIISSGVKTKVLMLSATPVNNRLNDLKNQIAFVTEGDDYALTDHGINNISQTLKRAQTKFNDWLKNPDDLRTTDQLLNSLNFDYFKVLDLLTIARSRKHIEKYYNLEEIGQFPTRLKPINIQADFDTQAEFPSLRDINKTISRLNLSTFAPLKYVALDKRKLYEQKYDTKLKGSQSVFSQLDREKSLIGLIKINMLKRLESTVHSFHLTAQRLLADVERTIKKLEHHAQGEVEEMDILETDMDSPELESLMVGKKVKVLIQDMDQAQWLYDLKEDQRYLTEIVNMASSVNAERDQKLALLKQQIQQKIAHPLNPGNRKIIIFTAFADTAQYLYKHLSDWALETQGIHSALIVGSGTNKTTQPKLRAELNELLTAFSPLSKERDKTGIPVEAEIDLLIATDCISEGQNLQDGDYLINYDIHWNPVRIIQRFGRIDRLGSKNSQIQLVNFWPNMELDEYIDLEARVSGRMVLLDVSATGEENIIDETNAGRMRDLEYRKKQLKELQDTVLDLEDISGGLSITDLTLNDFKMDLSNYMKTHLNTLEQAPNGLYSVVKLDEALQNAGLPPGVIFCVKNLAREFKSENERANEPYALFPYFLVYVTEQQTIALPYTQAKKTLDILKKHSLGRAHPDSALFQQLGSSSQFQSHLKQAIAHIQGKKVEEGMNSLFSRGGTQLDAFNANSDFEVISYLILVDGKA